MERTPGAETVEACSRALHPDERAELAEAAQGEERRIVFGRIWTRKEACLKGLGTGLSRSPAADCLGADTGRHPPGWTVIDIPCEARHTAAAAVRGPAPATVDVRRLPGAWLLTPGADHFAPPAGARVVRTA
ncbi:4'-phosphopantetheinyl transferase superfamily protein [Streptomyces mutabilis]|uniref:4'-phosphopantetheinyl transferase superfamily protein n=1 Tax=Streptomyces mutabilis TaxID=67332 RepID=UPI00069471FD